MELKKILIISPALGNSVRESFPMAPPILAYLAALVPKEIEVELIDMGAGDAIDYSTDVDLVCISSMTSMFTIASKISRSFRDRSVLVAMGGHHPTVRPLEVRKHADIVFMGEGEKTFPKMLDDFRNDSLCDFYVGGDWDIVPGLPGRVYQVKERPDMKNLPIPRKSLLKQKYPIDTLLTHRGCPYACNFCSISNYYGRKIRLRPLDDVKAEIETLGKVFYLLGDNCFANPCYFLELLDLLEQSAKKRTWFTQGSLSIVNHPRADEILSRAAQNGLSILMAGIESLDKDCLNSANASRKVGYRGEPDIEFTQYAIKKIQSHGIVVWGYIIFGFMNEKLENFERTYQFIKKTNILPCLILLNLLPETKLYEEYKNFIIPSRAYQPWYITHYINNFKPYEIEKEINALQRRVYSIASIAKRLTHTPLKSIIPSMNIQLGMRKVYRKNHLLIEQNRLPDSQQLNAKEYALQTKDEQFFAQSKITQRKAYNW